MAKCVKFIVPTTGIPAFATMLGGLLSYNPGVEVYVVLNTDEKGYRRYTRGVVDEAREGGATVQLFVAPDKIGYVRACNIGYAGVHTFGGPGDLIGVLNDDVLIRGDIVTPLVAALDAGAAQAGPSVHWVGKDGYWGTSADKYLYCEGWCWLARAETLERACLSLSRDNTILYDPEFSPGLCEDQDLSIRIMESGVHDDCRPLIKQVPRVPIIHTRGMTFIGSREPFWTRNREYLQRKWKL